MNKHTKLLFWLVLWLGFCLISLPTNATSSYIHEKTIDWTWTITICDPTSNGTKCITMMDRNLWATSNDITSTVSYWNYYQWWKNGWYGTYSSVTTSGSQISCSTNSPSNPVSSSVFIIHFIDYCTTATRNDNLWWWWSDEQSNRWYDTTNNRVINLTDRKWPCPTDYHVPSQWEWSKVVEYYVANYDEDIVLWDEDWLKYFNTENNDSAVVTPALAQMQEDFKIPLAGYRINNDASLQSVGAWAFLWSSSPIDVGARFFYLDPSGAHANAATYRAYGLPVRCFKDEPLKFIPLIEPTDSSIQVTIWETEYDELPNTMEVITEIEEESVGRKPVVWEVKVDFWEDISAKFNKLVQINIPVEDEEQVIVKVKHAWSNEYNFDWLTLNRNASCNDNWRPTLSQYNWEIITVVDWYASIYTCEASSFIALWLWSWEAIWEVTLTLTAWENTCTLNDYNLWTHNVSSEDQNVSTSWQNIVCEFLKNPWATIQLSMWDLVDWTKEIWRQYFTWIVTSLWNSLWSIANLTWWSYNFLSSHIIYTKEVNTIWTWTWSLAIEWIIPAWTPSWEYTWELNIIICEGC